MEMYALFASYRDTVIIVDPVEVRATMKGLEVESMLPPSEAEQT